MVAASRAEMATAACRPAVVETEVITFLPDAEMNIIDAPLNNEPDPGAAPVTPVAIAEDVAAAVMSAIAMMVVMLTNNNSNVVAAAILLRINPHRGHTAVIEKGGIDGRHTAAAAHGVGSVAAAERGGIAAVATEGIENEITKEVAGGRRMEKVAGGEAARIRAVANGAGAGVDQGAERDVVIDSAATRGIELEEEAERNKVHPRLEVLAAVAMSTTLLIKEGETIVHPAIAEIVAVATTGGESAPAATTAAVAGDVIIGATAALLLLPTRNLEEDVLVPTLQRSHSIWMTGTEASIVAEAAVDDRHDAANLAPTIVLLVDHLMNVTPQAVVAAIGAKMVAAQEVMAAMVEKVETMAARQTKNVVAESKIVEVIATETAAMEEAAAEVAVPPPVGIRLGVAMRVETTNVAGMRMLDK